ncbi:MAG: site-specific integrase [Magnetospirillum sp.]|nr:site-specific integrase [Magnetospirillum sp.]
MTDNAQENADVSAALSEAGASMDALAAEGDEYDRKARALSTLAHYHNIWMSFQRWCDRYCVSALPAEPEIVALYITDIARRVKAASISVHLAAIGHHHRAFGHTAPSDHPVVRTRLAGIRRTKGVAPVQKTPLLLENVDQIIGLMGDQRPQAIRDSALILLGWAAGLRRNEIVGLDVGRGQSGDGRGYVVFTVRGLDVVLTRTKTDQEGNGRTIAVPMRRSKSKCPVRLLRQYLMENAIEHGPIFRPFHPNRRDLIDRRLDASGVARIVKRWARRLGLDSGTFGGHSLRSGFVTETLNAGATVAAVQATTGHRRIDTVYRYHQVVHRYRESPLNDIGAW